MNQNSGKNLLAGLGLQEILDRKNEAQTNVDRVTNYSINWIVNKTPNYWKEVDNNSRTTQPNTSI